MPDDIETFAISVPQADLDDLRHRLERTRWPEREPVNDWSQGAPLDKVRELCDYWANGYDWRRIETRLNALGQYRTAINGVGIHFLHVRSPHADALPLLMTHGWPGSIMEFMKVIGPLADPAAHGGDPGDAFHIVIPSLPGYGFSDKPDTTGWDAEKIADAWMELMRRLGYDRWVSQGGDWGGVVTRAIGCKAPTACAAIHLTLAFVPPTPEDMVSLTPTESRYLEKAGWYQEWDSGYAKLQSTRPQTVGYALNDSPAGQAAWIYEKLQAWTDHDDAVESVLSLDEMLDNISLYWLTRTATSSARMYWESLAKAAVNTTIQLPTAFTQFPGEIMGISRRWGERIFSNLIYWNEAEKGGHFAAWEQPGIFVREVRDAFRSIR